MEDLMDAVIEEIQRISNEDPKQKTNTNSNAKKATEEEIEELLKLIM